MKKLFILFFILFTCISEAQGSFFRGNNNYQSPSIFAPTMSATSVVSNISRYGASSGGIITDNGGAPILASGICWSSTSSTPTILDNKTTDGTTIGTFISSLTGLTAGVTYNVRAYATNSKGTSYGAVQTFTTTPTLVIPTVGSSLGGGKVAYVYQNGDPGYTSTSIPVLIAANANQAGSLAGGTEKWSIGGLTGNAQRVGLIGSTYEALGAGLSNTNAIISAYGNGNYAAKLARNYTDGTYTDWYLPSKNEFSKLYENRNAIGGFSADRYWVSSEIDQPASTNTLGISFNFTNGFSGGDSKAWNLLVRPVRTLVLSSSTTPVLATTTPAASISSTSALVEGSVTDEGMTQVSARGFVYGTSAGSSTYSVTTGSGAGSFTTTLTGLTEGTTYYFRPFATNAQGISYGTAEQTFTTTFSAPNIVTNGLVLHLDAGNPSSYNGNGNTWTDLSGSGNNGTLVGGVTYNSSNQGSLVFNGNSSGTTDSYVNLPATTDFAFSSGDFTVEMWVYANTGNNVSTFISMNSTSASGFAALRLEYYNSNLDAFHSSDGASHLRSETAISPLTANKWTHLVLSRINGNAKIYLDGVEKLSYSLVGSLTASGNSRIGSLDGFTNRNHSGKVAITRIYKGKGLTSTEVTTNFDAVKSRFGL